VSPWLWLPPLGSGQLRGRHVPPRLPLHLPAQGSSGSAMCHLGSTTQLLSQGSSGATTCPEDRLYRLQGIKQISPGDPAIMIFIGAHAHVSSKALHNKGCSAHLQGVQQVAH
jgi:hypothetical protein